MSTAESTQVKPFTASRNNFMIKQPGKTVWIFCAIISTIVRLPFWLLVDIFPGFRPQREWTYRQSITNKVMKAGTYFVFAMRIPPTLSLAPCGEKERFVVLEPAADKFYQGMLADNTIKPTTTGGTWYPVPHCKGDTHNRIVLHFHGGAYVMGSGRDQDTAFAAKLLIQYLGAKVFAPQYRLGSIPGGRFPAALQDAVTSYKHLLDLGISASSIILSGDSAGAHLVVSLLRYLSENKDLLPAPSAALLWSSWLDLVPHCGSIDSNRNFGTDYVSDPIVVWGTEGFVPEFMQRTDPYISHASHPFATETPMWVGYSGGEVMEDQNVEFVKNMKQVDGNLVEMYVEPHTVHGIISIGNLSGFEAAARSMASVAGAFLDRLNNQLTPRLEEPIG